MGEIAFLERNFTSEDGSPYPVLDSIAVPAASHSYAYDGPVPVLFGHYWRRSTPEHLVDFTARTACLDFSAVKGEALTAYR